MKQELNFNALRFFYNKKIFFHSKIDKILYKAHLILSSLLSPITQAYRNSIINLERPFCINNYTI